MYGQFDEKGKPCGLLQRPTTVTATNEEPIDWYAHFKQPQFAKGAVSDMEPIEEERAEAIDAMMGATLPPMG